MEKFSRYFCIELENSWSRAVCSRQGGTCPWEKFVKFWLLKKFKWREHAEKPNWFLLNYANAHGSVAYKSTDMFWFRKICYHEHLNNIFYNISTKKVNLKFVSISLIKII